MNIDFDLIVTLVTAALTAAISAWVKLSVDHRFKEQKEHEAQRQEEREAQKEKERQDRKADVIVALSAELAPIQNSIDSLTAQVEKVSDGTLSTLRNEILTCYYKCREKGYRNDYDYTNIHDLDEAYIALGGNSFIGDIMERFDKLPTKEEFEHNITK